MHDPLHAVEAALTRSAGRRVRVLARSPLGGGSISVVERLDTDAGPYVLKSNADAPADFFDAEAAGLEALRSAGSPLVIPRVVAATAETAETASGTGRFILLEYLPPGQRDDGFDERFGTGLAALHRTTHESFGFGRDTFCGATRQQNAWRDRWVDFYAHARLAPLVEQAARMGLLSRADGRAFERIVSRLEEWLDEPRHGPALIHGDLWRGNVLVTTDGRPALLDPAACYAHREAELGMMTLFGGFAPRVFEAYDAAFPLEPGWRERHPLYQLYHVLNHVCLFGAGYLAQARAIARPFV